MYLNVLLFFCYVCYSFGLDRDIIDLLTPDRKSGEACGYLGCLDLVEGMKLYIHVVPYSHTEMGYTGTFYEHYSGWSTSMFENIKPIKNNINVKRILDYAISELWANEDRTFTYSDMAYFFQWWADRDETVRRMVYTLLRQGRLSLVGGAWGITDEATTSYHAIIDQFTYTLRKINATFLECGRPLVAWQPDVIGHSREFASLMAQMGFDGLFISPISYDDELPRMRRKALEFVWRGSDDLGPDSDIYTHKLYDGYRPPPGFCFGLPCKDSLIVASSKMFGNAKERMEEFIKIIRERQAPFYTTQHVMVMMGTRDAYHDASVWFSNIEALMKLINGRYAGVQMFYSTPACYLKSVYDSSPQLQTKQDDFFPLAYDRDSYAVGMYTSRPALKFIARECHRYLQNAGASHSNAAWSIWHQVYQETVYSESSAEIAKQLQVMAWLGNNDAIFEEYNWINGALQDHNIITGEILRHAAKYYVARWHRATRILLDKVWEKGFNTLRNNTNLQTLIKCKFNVSRCHSTTGEHMYIVIYNPLPWPVTMPVRLPTYQVEQIVYDHKGKKIFAGQIEISEQVQAIPERKSSVNYELIFIAKDLPPMGIRSYYFQRHRMGWRRTKRSNKVVKRKRKNLLKNDILLDEDLSDYEYFDDITTTTTAETITVNTETKMTVKTEDDDVTTMTVKAMDTTAITNKIDNITQPTTSAYPNSTFVIEWSEITTNNIVTELNDETVSTTEDLKTTTTTEKSMILELDSTTDSTKVTGVTTDAIKPILRVLDLSDTKHKDETSDDDRDDEGIDYWSYYPSFIVNEDSYIRNRFTRVNLDAKKRVINMLVAKGLRIQLGIQMYYFVSDDPRKYADVQNMPRPPGAYLFRTMDSKEEILNEYEANVYKNQVVQELHIKFCSWASVGLRLYRHSPVLEVDWLVGPIPLDDGLGKEILIKYTTNLTNKGVFYTDSNGRQTLKRIRNMRPTFNPVNEDTIAGNFYPVTSKIYIEDLEQNLRFAVLNDRTQGGSSLRDGEINMLLHRRHLTADSIIGGALNETEYGQGTVVRGQHYIYLSRADHKPYKVFEKKLAKEIELKPQILTSPAWGFGKNGKRIWEAQRNEFSGLKSKLPLGVQILTMEQWNDNGLLLRFENFLEKADCVHSGIKKVFLKDLFSFMEVLSIKETTLSGHILLKDWVPLSWKRDQFLKSFNAAYGSRKYEFVDKESRVLQDVDVNGPIVLAPQQIRTFVVQYRYINI